MILEFQKTDTCAITPTRANPSDAGLDVYACLEDSAVVVVHPQQSKIIPTGLKFGIPHGYMLEVKNRSGVAAKRSLLVGACVIDSGYDGEVFINLHNVGHEIQTISHGQKIAQLVMVPVVHFRAMEKREGELYVDPICISDRGDGSLGSTG